VGDVFSVPLADGDAVQAQVNGREADLLNSVTIALLDARGRAEKVGAAELQADRIFSKLFVTRDLLDSWRWRVVRRAPVAVPQSEQPHETLRSRRFIGAKGIGSGIVEDCVNSYYGLAPWSPHKDPGYFDELLVDPPVKPMNRLICE
jgi:hypothetical protein